MSYKEYCGLIVVASTISVLLLVFLACKYVNWKREKEKKRDETDGIPFRPDAADKSDYYERKMIDCLNRQNDELRKEIKSLKLQETVRKFGIALADVGIKIKKGDPLYLNPDNTVSTKPFMNPGAKAMRIPDRVKLSNDEHVIIEYKDRAWQFNGPDLMKWIERDHKDRRVQKLKLGKSCMADKEFTISDMLDAQNVARKLEEKVEERERTIREIKSDIAHQEVINKSLITRLERPNGFTQHELELFKGQLVRIKYGSHVFGFTGENLIKWCERDDIEASNITGNYVSKEDYELLHKIKNDDMGVVFQFEKEISFANKTIEDKVGLIKSLKGLVATRGLKIHDMQKTMSDKNEEIEQLLVNIKHLSKLNKGQTLPDDTFALIVKRSKNLMSPMILNARTFEEEVKQQVTIDVLTTALEAKAEQHRRSECQLNHTQQLCVIWKNALSELNDRDMEDFENMGVGHSETDVTKAFDQAVKDVETARKNYKE